MQEQKSRLREGKHSVDCLIQQVMNDCFLICMQIWDDELERSATQWAEECQWDHGPQDLLMSIGQNLAVHWGR